MKWQRDGALIWCCSNKPISSLNKCLYAWSVLPRVECIYCVHKMAANDRIAWGLLEFEIFTLWWEMLDSRWWKWWCCVPVASVIPPSVMAKEASLGGRLGLCSLKLVLYYVVPWKPKFNPLSRKCCAARDLHRRLELSCFQPSLFWERGECSRHGPWHALLQAVETWVTKTIRAWLEYLLWIWHEGHGSIWGRHDLNIWLWSNWSFEIGTQIKF